MRKLYEINADLEAVLSQVDEETGELTIDPEALDALLMERTDKLEGMALLVKDWNAEAAAIKAEEAALKERRERIEKKRDGLRDYLQQVLAGEKLETAKVSVTYRKSKSVEIDPAVFWEHPAEMFIRQKDPEPDKKAITDALKNGGTVPGAALVEKVSMTIK